MTTAPTTIVAATTARRLSMTTAALTSAGRWATSPSRRRGDARSSRPCPPKPRRWRLAARPEGAVCAIDASMSAARGWAPQSTAVTADRDDWGLLDVRGASRWVAAEAASVSLDAARLDRLAGLLAGSPVEAAPWSVHHLGDGPAEAVAGWTLALSA